METAFYALISLFAGATLVWLILGRKSTSGAQESNSQNLMLLQQMTELQKVLDAKLSESRRDMAEAVNTQFGRSQELILQINRDMIKSLGDVKVEQTKANEATRQMVTIAEELQSLQDILKNPKQRGILGEYYLETLLTNVLPAGSYKMQYPFKDGEIVDAAVFVKDKVIPIDSKFSLENYNRLVEARDPSEKLRLEKLFVNDLKKRITETAKYIRPGEGTMDFAFMFIPHEAIYYDLLVNKVGAVADEDENLIQRAAGKYRVIIVSPTSFLAYLQTVLQGLRAMQIEENIKGTIKQVSELSKHLKSYEEYHNKLGNALGTVFNHYSASSKEFKKMDKDIVKITDSEASLEPLMLDKPGLLEE